VLARVPALQDLLARLRPAAHVVLAHAQRRAARRVVRPEQPRPARAVGLLELRNDVCQRELRLVQVGDGAALLVSEGGLVAGALLLLLHGAAGQAHGAAEHSARQAGGTADGLEQCVCRLLVLGAAVAVLVTEVLADVVGARGRRLVLLRRRLLLRVRIRVLVRVRVLELWLLKAHL
jgi:hypothetical protein